MQRIGLIVNHKKPRSAEMLSQLAKTASKLGLHLVADARTVELLGCGNAVAPEALAGQVEAIIVLGGDGTLLSAARSLGRNDVPLLGLNIGSLGYLTSVSQTQIAEALRCLREDRCSISRRARLASRVLRGDVAREGCDALNDVVVSRGASGRVVWLDVYIDDRFVSTYVCDGLIVATPTGSTAYALSAGGPIVMPGAGVLTMSVICPHTLSSRPLVVSDDACFKVHVRKASAPMIVSIDGQDDHSLQTDDRVEIRRAELTVGLMGLPGYDPYVVLSRKLGWAGRPATQGARPKCETGADEHG